MSQDALKTLLDDLRQTRRAMEPLAKARDVYLAAVFIVLAIGLGLLILT